MEVIRLKFHKFPSFNNTINKKGNCWWKTSTARHTLQNLFLARD